MKTQLCYSWPWIEIYFLNHIKQGNLLQYYSVNKTEDFFNYKKYASIG